MNRRTFIGAAAAALAASQLPVREPSREDLWEEYMRLRHSKVATQGCDAQKNRVIFIVRSRFEIATLRPECRTDRYNFQG